MRQLARPQMQSDYLRLQPVGEDYLALPDEEYDENDNSIIDASSLDDYKSGANIETNQPTLEHSEESNHLLLSRDSVPRKRSTTNKHKLPYWLILSPEENRTHGPRVRLRFHMGSLTAEEARTVIERAERSIEHLVRRVNQEILLW